MGQLVLLTGCLNNYTEDTPVKVTVQDKMNFEYFDTVSYVYSYANDSAEVFAENANKVFEILGEYNRLFDIYKAHYDKDDKMINNLYTVKDGTWDKGGGTWSKKA